MMADEKGLTDDEIELVPAFGRGEISLQDICKETPRARECRAEGTISGEEFFVSLPDYVDGLVRAQMQAPAKKIEELQRALGDIQMGLRTIMTRSQEVSLDAQNLNEHIQRIVANQ